MKKVNRVLWGIILIALGVVFMLNAFGITDIDVFFDGWWTLFIIVPCAVGIITERDKTGNLIGLAVGVVLLLWRQDILDIGILWKLILPVIIIAIGLKLLFGGMKKKKADEIVIKMKAKGGQPKVGCATFSGCDMNFDGQIFEGAELVAVFGGVKCDLRNALIDQDCVIDVTAVFGGIDILVPHSVNVKVDSTSIFGGVSNKTVGTDGAPTLYIKGLCLFGGVDVK